MNVRYSLTPFVVLFCQTNQPTNQPSVRLWVRTVRLSIDLFYLLYVVYMHVIGTLIFC